jgi:hypothetical protein
VPELCSFVTLSRKPLIDDPKEAEKRLEQLLEKGGGPNPKAKEDFTLLLQEMARQNSR